MSSTSSIPFVPSSLRGAFAQSRLANKVLVVLAANGLVSDAFSAERLHPDRELSTVFAVLVVLGNFATLLKQIAGIALYDDQLFPDNNEVLPHSADDHCRLESMEMFAAAQLSILLRHSLDSSAGSFRWTEVLNALLQVQLDVVTRSCISFGGRGHTAHNKPHAYIETGDFGMVLTSEEDLGATRRETYSIHSVHQMAFHAQVTVVRTLPTDHIQVEAASVRWGERGPSMRRLGENGLTYTMRKCDDSNRQLLRLQVIERDEITFFVELPLPVANDVEVLHLYARQPSLAFGLMREVNYTIPDVIAQFEQGTL